MRNVTLTLANPHPFIIDKPLQCTTGLKLSKSPQCSLQTTSALMVISFALGFVFHHFMSQEHQKG